MPDGERGETGHYPEGTINERAETKFIEYSERPKKIGATLNSRMARQVKDNPNPTLFEPREASATAVDNGTVP